jgi:lipid A 3-O-deacylase
VTLPTARDVTARSRGRTWVEGLVVAAIGLASLRGATAQELAAGMKAVGLGAAISISVSTEEGLDGVNGFQLLPHFGYVVTDLHGSDWLRGNLEVLLEPALIQLKSEKDSPTVGGLSGIARWIFMGGDRVRPYLEAGAGILVGDMDLVQTDCSVNFLLQGGPGLLFYLSETTSLTVGYRFQHISNAGACDANVGINSSAVYLGVTHFFR